MSGVPVRRTPLAIIGGVAFARLVAVLFAVIGLWSSDSASAVPVPGNASVEAGFSRDMAVHHQQAVEMSLIVRDRTDDEVVRTLAYDVINTQATQRGMLLGWLETWGLNKSASMPPMTWMGHGGMYEAKDGSLMPGIATNTQIEQLRQAQGKEAEVLYLQLMTAHHKGGVRMARGAVEKSSDEKAVRLAQSMVDGQQAEIDLMAGMLAARGAEAKG